MVSAYFHTTRHKHSFSGSFDDFIKDPKKGLPALIDYLNNWARALPRHEHFVLTYETLSADTFAATAAALQFLGIEVDEPSLREAVEKSRFDSMKAQEKREGLPSHDYDRSDDEALRMRRGKAGGFRDYLTADQVAELDRWLDAELVPAARALVERTGYRFGRSVEEGKASPLAADALNPASAIPSSVA
jgi:alcohol sulfotransferase